MCILTESLCDKLGLNKIWNKFYDYSEQIGLFPFLPMYLINCFSKLKAIQYKLHKIKI